MYLRHLIRRGNRYIFVCRIPSDLSPLFPKPTIWKSLKTDNEKDAYLLASAEEYRTQQLFLQLRSGMLSKDLEKRLIAAFLTKGVERIEAHATCTTFSPGDEALSPLDPLLNKNAKDEQNARRIFERMMHANGSSPEDTKEAFKRLLKEDTELLREQLIAKDTDFAEDYTEQVADELKKNDVKLTESDKKRLGLKFVEATIQLNEAELASIDGYWNALRMIKESANKDLALPYKDLKTALAKYQEHYIASKPNVKSGTKDDMTVECRVLLEICGNISISEFNSMDTVTKVKRVLLRYPKNKAQRYGNKSIHTILKNESGYEKISLKTANEYLKRAKAVIEYAGKEKWINTTNVWDGELFATERAAEEQRLPYGTEETTRLIDALSTKSLWRYNPPKPERFWIVLIALFHGLRLGNILALTKEDICKLDNGMWVFRLRTGKTAATVRPVAICDSLLLLGFLEWVESLKREKLFQDTVKQFSSWYNKDEKQKGKEVLGFESRYVTRDKKKCLYSLRHSFAGNVFDVSSDFKITADMMGHSTGNSVTARYTKATKAGILKEMMEKMNLDGVDLDKLEARAQELFFRE